MNTPGPDPDRSPTPLVVGISGASGVVFGVRILEILSHLDHIETHLVMSGPARVTLGLETDMTPSQVEELADVVHPVRDIGASIASGSFRTAGMIVAPCSIRSLSAIANSLGGDLLTRTADVTLKERRPLVLMVRETPLHRGHLRLMSQAAESGAVIFPPVPAFYTRPRSVADLVNHTALRALDVIGLGADLDEASLGAEARWTGRP